MSEGETAVLKKVLFQLHWLFGISAGLVLALMGVTGAMLSFQDEILRAINPESLVVEKRAEAVLPMDELIRRVESAEPGKKVAFFWLKTEGVESARIFFTPPPGQRRGESLYVDPYTAEALPAPVGEGAFMFIMQLHRFLAAGEVGQRITAACTLILIFFCLSGLYLRWPRKALNWRTWLTFDWRKKGRAFNWDLHAVAGTWCLVFYLLASLTGLYWSYEWYRNGLFKLLDDTPAGQAKGGQRGGGKRGPAPEGPPPVVDATAIWNTIQQTGGSAMTAYNLRLPPVKGQPATVFYLLDGAAHERAFNEMTIDPASGKLLKDRRYNDSSAGKQLLTSVYALHVGSYFGLTGRILMMLASLAMPLFFITGWLLYLDRHRKKRAALAARGELGTTAGGADSWLVGYASQSGFAEQLAWQSAGQLQAAGLPVRVEPLGKLDRVQLEQTRNALFVVSTFGEGEAPDSARGFERQVLGQSLGLNDLRFAVLALGDRQYEHFCGFARRMQGWLQGQGARPLFDGVEVDNGDAAALHDWQVRLAELSGTAPQVAVTAPAFEVWTLSGREHLNPGSQGESTWLLRLGAPSDSQIDWAAGDLVEIVPRQPEFLVSRWLERLGLDGSGSVQVDGLAMPLKDALAGCLLPANLEHLVGQHGQAVVDALIKLSVRQYSIASLRSEGSLELIVRQEQHADGSLGICSGWLTQYLPEGGSLLLRLRRNRSFHLTEEDRPLILIGNGTGIAGLRALLQASVAEGRSRNWLLFGERNIAHDFYCRDELEGMLARGELQRLDVAFSRDQAEKVYVQDRLRDSAETLAQWLEEGAVIYVCGSLQGMAEGVDRALREMLGDTEVEGLLETGRYRRDVY